MPPGEEESIASHALVGGRDHPEFKTCKLLFYPLDMSMTELFYRDRYCAQSVLSKSCSKKASVFVHCIRPVSISLHLSIGFRRDMMLIIRALLEGILSPAKSSCISLPS